jgi:predicted phosphoribosyltransferase
MELKGQEAVLLALKEESMTACIALAAQINAWIYPLLSEKITIPGDPRIMGVVNDGGIFVWSPDISTYERDGIEMDSRAVLEDAKRVAFSKLNQKSSLYGTYSKEGLVGRTLLLVGDIVRDRMEISAALEYLKSVRYARLYSVGGNVDALAADFMHLQTDHDIELDVMTNMFDDGHYFEQQDSYSADECRQLMVNIAQYWT